MVMVSVMMNVALNWLAVHDSIANYVPSVSYPSICKAAVCEHDEPATNPEQAHGFIRGVGAGGGGG